MSFLKAAIALAAVAGVGYVGYKAAKKHPKAAAAIITAMAKSGSSAAARSTATSKTIHIHERETVITPDESEMEGVMGISSRAKETPVKVRVRSTDSDRIDVTVTRPVLGMMDTIDYADGQAMFGGDSLTKFPL